MNATVDSAPLQAQAALAGSNIEDISSLWRGRIDARLVGIVDAGSDGCCRQLDSAMRYSLLAPGKRVRPLLAILAALDFDRPAEPILDFGCALEMVHCASLMLDDLPCMDDARMRRGLPACHLHFGEATTMLAAIALLNQAFWVLSRSQALPDPLRAGLVARLSKAVGTAGLVSGQSRDLSERGRLVDDEQLRRINHQKTSVLFELALVGGGLICDLGPRRLARLEAYAHHVGQAFQAADDLLDYGRATADSGKDIGADRGKAGSIHDLGEPALRQRLAAEMGQTGTVLRELSLGGGLLDGYVRALFARFD
ncbi:MAG: polyprenyl synthetase family protein [Wenzhouxiangellaceae bacterium]|nr:polyprenyl synthetase family protein [Wenzhouxiangellaceae bacterium]